MLLLFLLLRLLLLLLLLLLRVYFCDCCWGFCISIREVHLLGSYLPCFLFCAVVYCTVHCLHSTNAVKEKRGPRQFALFVLAHKKAISAYSRPPPPPPVLRQTIEKWCNKVMHKIPARCRTIWELPLKKSRHAQGEAKETWPDQHLAQHNWSCNPWPGRGLLSYELPSALDVAFTQPL